MAQGPVTKTLDAAPSRQDLMSFSWTDTALGPGIEHVVPNVPRKGIIKRFTASWEAGAAATVQPLVGRSAGFTANSQNEVLNTPAAAVHIDEGPVYYHSPEGTLYVQPNASAGACTVSFELLIVPGWND